MIAWSSLILSERLPLEEALPGEFEPLGDADRGLEGEGGFEATG